MIERIADLGIKMIQQIRANRLTSYLLFSLLAFTFFSCDSSRVYEEYYSAGASGWNKDSVAVFQVQISDTTTHYNLLVDTRNLENYPFSNLWMFIDVLSPDSVAIRDTMEVQLAYPNGKWTGKGTSGVYENQFMYRRNIFFPKAGNYTFKVHQGMRDTTLKGLKDVGLRIETFQ